VEKGIKDMNDWLCVFGVGQQCAPVQLTSSPALIKPDERVTPRNTKRVSRGGSQAGE